MALKTFTEFEKVFEVATVTAKTTSSIPTEKTEKIPTNTNALIKKAKEKNDEVADLLEKLKFAQKEKALFDNAVMEKLSAMKATTIKVGKILAYLDTTKGRESYSYTEAQNILYKSLFAVNQEAAAVALRAVEALKHKNPDKTEVKYVGEGLSEVAKQWWASLKTTFAEWKKKFFEAADKYEDAAANFVKNMEAQGDKNIGEIWKSYKVSDEDRMS